MPPALIQTTIGMTFLIFFIISVAIVFWNNGGKSILRSWLQREAIGWLFPLWPICFVVLLGIGVVLAGGLSGPLFSLILVASFICTLMINVAVVVSTRLEQAELAEHQSQYPIPTPRVPSPTPGSKPRTPTPTPQPSTLAGQLVRPHPSPSFQSSLTTTPVLPSQRANRANAQIHPARREQAVPANSTATTQLSSPQTTPANGTINRRLPAPQTVQPDDTTDELIAETASTVRPIHLPHRRRPRKPEMTH